MANNPAADAQIILGGDAHLNVDRKGSFVDTHDIHAVVDDYEGKPTEEERLTLRRVAGSVPTVAYLICIVEFAERSSYYGVQPLFSNFVNRPLPAHGNGYGAPPAGGQGTAGALGMGTVKATAVSQSFSMLTYTLPLLFAWLADTKTGRYKMVFAGVWVCGISHVLMCAAGAPSLLASGNAKIPFFISVYILCLGAGSDLGNVLRVLGICFKRGGIKRMFGKGKGFFEPAKPSVIALSGSPIEVPWNDAFVNDVRRAFQATGIFCFFPIQYINDNGLGNSASALSTMLTTNGVPNDVIGNFNSLSIIIAAPILNFGLYPLLRKYKIHYGPVSRMTTGLLMSAIGGVGYTVLNYYAYKLGPCGNKGTSLSCVDENGDSLVSSITIWYMAIPYAIGGISELFINVPAYGIAYSHAPKNMRGLVAALNLLSTGFAYAFGLAFAGLVKDPYLTWVFGAPSIIGFVAAATFYWLFRDMDNEEYEISDNGDYHLEGAQPAAAATSSAGSVSEKGVGVDEKKV
ncbi:putative Peptide transporter PTR2 [Glarea lozoyensis 74030]|uniref:Putative Peptide transporter PTR2 n=1 Tax=Glarea lozoyensis (strain ATCC 74030 / MF5533) TaxID=1104152 RepID=H0EF71_GLAL7|nr:putative Peptide transporter PTR2 [Glarea lozoyensis 74030]